MTPLEDLERSGNMDDLKSVVILLVEDDPGDQKLIKKSIFDQKISNKLIIMNSAEDALEYLEHSKLGEHGYSIPDLVLLDLNMPGMGGKEFLRRLKADDALDTIPVVILTSSASEQDILETYKLQAAGYVKKPPTLDDFREVFNCLEEYWFVICKRVPQREPSCAAIQ
jgi:two-component system, chemotaxis family, response regulator Rcp1